MELAKDETFRRCVPLSDAKEETAYRQELVLRFFSHMDYQGGEAELKLEHGEWLTAWMRRTAEKSTDEVGRIIDKSVFHRTFSLLDKATGEDTFRLWNGTRHLGPFSISSYEFVTTGVAHNLAAWEGAPEGELAERIRGIWSAEVFRDNSGTGVSPRRRVPRLVNRAREHFKR